MGSPKKSLILTKGLRVAVLIGIIGMVGSVYTWQTPMYPIYHIYEYEGDVILFDGFPMLEIAVPSEGKIVIEGLTTNGTPIMIELYESWWSNDPIATIENVTDIRNVFLAGAASNEASLPVFRISRYDNQSVLVSLSIRFWGTYPSTDYLVVGPSIFTVLVIPLLYAIHKHWGQTPTRRGWAILIIIVLSAGLITPVLVYNYSGWGTILRHDDVQDMQVHSFSLNTTNPTHEFNTSIETGPDAFMRIANFTTGNVPVAITIILDNDSRQLNLSSVKTITPSLLQFEFPKENVSELTVRLSRLALDATVNMSIETVLNVWEPWNDPLLFILSAYIGLIALIAAIIIPDEKEHLDSDVPSES